MMRIHTGIVLFILIFIFGGCSLGTENSSVGNKRIRFIYFSDSKTEDTKFNSYAANCFVIDTLVSLLGTVPGYQLDTFIFTGEKFNTSNLDSVESTMYGSGASDVILFLFTGHGNNDWQSEFPTLYLLGADGNSKAPIHLTSIYTKLKEVPHSLLIVAAESCNSGKRKIKRHESINIMDKELYRGVYKNSKNYLITSSYQSWDSHGLRDSLNPQPGFFIQAFRKIISGYIPQTEPVDFFTEDLMLRWTNETMRLSNVYDTATFHSPMWIGEKSFKETSVENTALILD